MTPNELEELLKSKSAKKVFGADPEKRFIELSCIAHPDRGGSPELFSLLNSSYESLTEKLELKSKKASYTLVGTPSFDGDLSSLYESGNLIVKLSKHPKANSVLEKEVKVIQELREPNTTFNSFLPDLIDSFPVKDKAGVTLHASVFNRKENVFSIGEILTKYPSGLDVRDMAWMWNRIASVVGYLHSQGYIHTSIIPEHCLVKLDDHCGMIVGLAHCVKEGEKVSFLSNKYKGKNYYPPELEGKDKVYKETDIYMLAKLGLSMVDSNTDTRIINFFNSCLFPNRIFRPDDAWSLHDDFNELLKSVVGKRSFRTFSMV